MMRDSEVEGKKKLNLLILLLLWSQGAEVELGKCMF